MRIFLDPVLAGMSGHLAASEFVMFEKNSDTFARAYTVPENPKTAAQTRVRGWQSISSKLWATGDEDDSAAWNEYSIQYFTTIVNGISRRPSGFQAFMRINNWRQLMGANATLVPPVSGPPAAAISVIPDNLPSATSMSIAIVHAVDPVTNWQCVLRTTPPTTSPANRPLAKNLRYPSLDDDEQFQPLPASGASATFNVDPHTYANGDRYGLTLAIVNPAFVLSSEVGGDFIATLA